MRGESICNLEQFEYSQQHAFQFDQPDDRVLRRDAKNHSPYVLNSDSDLERLLIPAEVHLSEQAQRHLASLSNCNRATYQSTRQQFIQGITRAFSEEFSRFWMSRYHQYTNMDRFVSRVARFFSMDVDHVYLVADYLSLPSCPRTADHARDIGSFQSVMFIDGTENLIDPLDRFYRRSVYRASNSEAWNGYLATYGWLPPDALNPSDIRYLCREYPMPRYRLAMLLQVKESELNEYVDSMRWPSRYSLSAAPIRDLLPCKRHRRLAQIVIRSAQALYTHQAIPLQVIAERIGVDRCTLFSLGERFGEEWRMPAPSTIHHVIEHVNLAHIANGGVIRRTAGL